MLTPEEALRLAAKVAGHTHGSEQAGPVECWACSRVADALLRVALEARQARDEEYLRALGFAHPEGGLDPKIAAEYVRAAVQEAEERGRRAAHNHDLDEALNSGDGSYKP